MLPLEEKVDSVVVCLDVLLLPSAVACTLEVLLGLDPASDLWLTGADLAGEKHEDDRLLSRNINHPTGVVTRQALCSARQHSARISAGTCLATLNLTGSSNSSNVWRSPTKPTGLEVISFSPYRHELAPDSLAPQIGSAGCPTRSSGSQARTAAWARIPRGF